MKSKILVLSAFFSILTFITSCSSTSGISGKNKSSITKTKEELISEMSLEEKIAQLFVVLPEQIDSKSITKLSKSFEASLKKYPVGGFILFKYHIENPEQIKSFTSELKSVSSISPIISVDEEGGRVTRFGQNPKFNLPQFASMNAVGQTGEPENARGAGQIIGSYLWSYGITMDFAPVADINTNPENIVIGNRSFGSDPHLVSKMDTAFLSGLHSTGVKGCLKHFPGHGDTKGDTHADYVAVTKTWNQIKDCELIPFIENLENTDSIMVAHVTFTDIDDKYPASLSKKLITEKLRGELGYNGLVLTDALDMGAIEKNFGSGEAAVLAFEAGNDILLMPKDFKTAYSAMISAVKSGRITEERIHTSLRRILTLKGY